ncbi:hypothetical protein MYF61_29545, partial [Klebsiella quasipneumoniae]|uniref:hypothetical protein n=1 Tax=Klebsiella quasipneumoniae TaxID=1463165 RepID=UPI002033732A
MVAAVMFVGLACIMYIPADPSSRWADLAKWQVTAARRAGLVSALVCMLFSVLRMKRALDLNAI